MAKSKDSKPAGGKGGGKADKADKSKKGGGKGNNSKADAGADSSDTKAAGKLKGMTINVRHILVCVSLQELPQFCYCDANTPPFFFRTKSVRNSPRARRPLAG